MSDEFDREAERVLAEHGAFEREEGDFGVTTTPLDARVAIEDAGEAIRYVVIVHAPTIDAAVDGGTVADVVREGWFETFERRVKAVGGVTRVDPGEPVVETEEGTREVRVTIAFETADPDRGAEDAKALVDFVEGTYLQGVIPGYDYREPVAGLLERAANRSEGTGRPKL